MKPAPMCVSAAPSGIACSWPAANPCIWCMWTHRERTSPKYRGLSAKAARLMPTSHTLRLLMVTLTAALGASAHDIPNDVTVQAFLKPEGQRLRLMVRAPMKAMRDVEFPQKGPGYLDLARTAPF